MDPFPSLVPNARSFNFGQFSTTEVKSGNGNLTRYLHSVTAQNYVLNLSYTALTDAEATLIRNHYIDHSGTHLSFHLPLAAWQGHTSLSNLLLEDTLWRYGGTPEEEHYSVGYVNVTVSLISDNSRREPIDSDLAVETDGGLSFTIEYSFNPGFLPALSAAIIASFTPGAATGS